MDRTEYTFKSVVVFWLEYMNPIDVKLTSVLIITLVKRRIGWQTIDYHKYLESV